MIIGVIGCGVMGSALAMHFAKKTKVILYDKNSEKTLNLSIKLGCSAAKTPMEAIANTDIIILAIKPKDLHLFAMETTNYFAKDQWLISVLAATSVGVLKKYFPTPTIIRSMPNLPLICGKGVMGFAETPQITQNQKEKINNLFQDLGVITWISEEKLEILSAFAGSSPAFILLLIEALVEGGVFLGLSYEEALNYILQVMEGSVALLRSTQDHPAVLKNKIASPGGTTIAGLKVLEESGIRGVVMNALVATYQKSKEMENNQHEIV